MRASILLLTLVLATSAFAGDVPLTIERTANCNGVVTLVDVESRAPLATCGLGCERVTVQVPAETWVRVDTNGAGGCSGVMAVEGQTVAAPHPRIGRITRAGSFRVGQDGNLVKVSFTWTPPRMNWYVRVGNSVK